MGNTLTNTVPISVIIPVYNVDKYIERCLDSILGQTYGNLDIILVDDGSIDRSGDICDFYAESDSRVRVIHKINGGLSDARNAGLEIAKGDYVYFVDSDDFITDDAIEFLYESILAHNADIATHGYVIYHGDDASLGKYKPDHNERFVLSNEDALNELMYEKSVTTSACMKLYKRHLFSDDIRFPLGKTCEDLATIYKLFSRADKIVLNTTAKYFYYQRPGSLTQSGFDANGMDGLYAAMDQLEYMNKAYPALITAARYRLFAEAIYIIMRLPLKNSLHNNYQKILLDVIRKYKRSVLCDRMAKRSMRQRALVAHLGARTMVRFYKTKSYVWRSLKAHKINRTTKLTNNTEPNMRINVLHVIGGMDRGGAETFLMNVLRTIDRDRFHFVFLCFGNDKFDYEQEAIRLGASIRRIPAISIRNRHIKNVTDIIKIIKEEKIDILHAHIYHDSVFSVIASWLARVKVRVVHSHASRLDIKPSARRRLYCFTSSAIIRLMSTKRVACGIEAGHSLFGSSRFEVIHNGIILDEFYYDKSSRVRIRKDLGISMGATVIGHVGRMDKLKNQAFAIEVFSEYLTINNEAYLLLVGDGKLRISCERQAKKLGVAERVRFLGKRVDIGSLYNAMDIFIFPSLHEGLPVTLVEAQTNGLRCLVSDSVDKDTKLTEAVEFYPLSKHASEWANKINTMNLTRLDTRKIMLDSPYNMRTGAKTIEKLYVEQKRIR